VELKNKPDKEIIEEMGQKFGKLMETKIDIDEAKQAKLSRTVIVLMLR